MNFTPILLPQLGVNDVSAIIITWEKENGDKVKIGEELCTVETSKTVFDIVAENEGYLTILKQAGEEVDIGDYLGAITEELVAYENVKNNVRSLFKSDKKQIEETQAIMTEKARLVALRNNVDISKIQPKKGRIAEKDVLSYIESLKQGRASQDFSDSVDDIYPTNKVQTLLIIGAGDGAVQLIDALTKVPRQKAVMLLDDNKSLHGKTVAGVPVVGDISYEQIESYHKEGRFDAAIISISTSVAFRAKVFENLQLRGVPFANVIHPSVCIGINVSIGSGNIILAFCHIGACVKIKNNNFISAYCSIEHHSILASHSSFGPGVITSSRVIIGDKVRFGTGIFIEPHVTIGEEALIGSGCIVCKDIPSHTVAKNKINYLLKKRV